jgi:YspA, cpYpsA-related SLOG family
MSAAKSIIVCGGRDYNDMRAVYAALDKMAAKSEIAMIIQGGADGADKMAFAWAFQRCIPCLSVPADWGQHGKAAGPIRNRKMLEYVVDGVVAFPGGDGTADMIRQAKEAGVPVWEPYRG